MQAAEHLPYLCKTLKLPTVYAHWKEIANTARTQGLNYGDFLATLLDLELTVKEQSKLERMVKQSKLLPAKTLSNFKFSQTKDVNQNQIEQLANNSDWVKKQENLILFGPSGAGKTHLACAIAYQQLQQGVKALFAKTTLLVQTLQTAKNEFRLKRELDRLGRFELLILDDMGYVKKSDQETSVLFELIESRYETGSVIITANQPFNEWDQLFPDPIMAVAAVDRLIHHATIISIDEDSYRAKQARLRNKQTEEVTA
jgi:DNA replication protein DnaC